MTPAVRPGWAARHPRAVDLLVALLALVVALGLARWTTLLPSAVPGFGGWWPNVVFVLSVGALVVRRDAPVAVFVVIVAAAVLLTFSVAPPALVPLMVAVATLVVHRGTRVGWVAAGSALVLLLVASIPAGRPLATLPPTLLGLGLAVMVGVTIATRRQYIAALVDRAERLELERDQEARLAVAAERTRIAREMHDVVAHGITIMIRLADGADAIRASSPERADAAVRQVAELGRTSLTDMRRLLGVLREDEALRAPQPGAASLDELVRRYRDAGLPVELRTTGELPAGETLQLAVYRAVQEALTNALRYAESPSTVDVHVAASGRGVAVTVVDDGRGGPSAPSQGSERGLVGLRERAAMFGGTVEAGPAPAGGWRVHVTFPEGS